MKFAHYMMILLALALCACTQEESIPALGPVSVDSYVEPYYTTADVSIMCDIPNGMENYLEYYFCYSNVGMNNPREQKMTFSNGICSCKLTGLEAETDYDCQFKIVGFNSDAIQEVRAFQTKPFSWADVRTDQIISYSHNNAIVSISLHYWGTDIVPEWGVCYGTHPTVEYEDNRIEFSGTTAYNTSTTCTINVPDLEDGVTYYVNAYAKNGWGVSYGQELSFTTIPYAIPTVETIDVSSVSANAAICYGNVVEEGSFAVENRGFCFDVTENPTIQNTIAESSVAGVGNFSCVLQGLKSKTTYYVRAYATNAKGTAYGNQISFTTK